MMHDLLRILANNCPAEAVILMSKLAMQTEQLFVLDVMAPTPLPNKVTTPLLKAKHHCARCTPPSNRHVNNADHLNGTLADHEVMPMPCSCIELESHEQLCYSKITVL